jgi:hypothetical protein
MNMKISTNRRFFLKLKRKIMIKRFIRKKPSALKGLKIQKNHSLKDLKIQNHSLKGLKMQNILYLKS